MPQVLFNIRMDEDLKKNMEKICKDLGMNMTTAFTIFAKKVSNERRIPFEVSIDPFYNETNQRALNESIAQLESGKTINKTIEELESMENE